jgi:glycosyltransferase involved in cell wall biosynthesis
MIALCDHSIANPAIVEAMIHLNGAWPSQGSGGAISPLWKLVMEDIDQADYLVVNSDFVKESFTRYGWPGDRIFVQYWGVDDSFLKALPGKTAGLYRDTARVTFSGDLSRRKGAHILLSALELLVDVNFELLIMASVPADMADVARALKADRRVSLCGYVSRAELAQSLANTDVFVFPSLVEGSARVVFEALAAGCYVITTENAGSIVRTGEQGELIPPGSPTALADALRRALSDLDRVRRIGVNNAKLITARYTQASYGESVAKIYSQLFGDRNGGSEH